MFAKQIRNPNKSENASISGGAPRRRPPVPVAAGRMTGDREAMIGGDASYDCSAMGMDAFLCSRYGAVHHWGAV